MKPRMAEKTRRKRERYAEQRAAALRKIAFGCPHCGCGFPTRGDLIAHQDSDVCGIGWIDAGDEDDESRLALRTQNAENVKRSGIQRDLFGFSD